PRVEHAHRLIELALQDDDLLLDVIAMFGEKGFGEAIASEEPGGFAAAVEAHVERVVRPMSAGVQDLGAAIAQMLLAPFEQLAADALLAIGRFHAEQTGDADR